MNNEPTGFEEGVFIGALALRPDDQMAFVRRACGENADLCRRVAALLREHASRDGALDVQPAAEFAVVARTLHAQAPCDLQPSGRIGRYELQRKIGEGGFGVVWLAEQREPVRRQVALKIIRSGMDSREAVLRFEVEQQALALMDHPNIARVYDGGAAGNGLPYFVMEFVPGVPITRYCDEHQLGAAARLDLFLQVCRAMQHAHQKGIIHRDLKPSNILVAEHDGVAVPKVIDFGIAKALPHLRERLTDATRVTLQAHVMGTPAYMSPEQMEIGRADIDTRSDIYNLGVLLYELLTGQTPFDAQKLASSSFAELRRLICEQEPMKPSTRIGTLDVDTRETIARQRATDFAKLRSTLRGDIDWIVMRCLEKERARRYDTANGLARDIERHLHNEPVTARPPTAAYLLRKTVRRHRVAFAAGGAIAASLVFAVMAKAAEARRATAAEQTALAERALAEKSRDEAEAHKRTAENESARSLQVAQFMKDMLKGVGPQVALGRDTKLLRAIFDEAAKRVQSELARQPLVHAEMLETFGQAYSALGEYRSGEQMLRQALATQERLLGRETETAARLLHHIGVAVARQGTSWGAELPLREALAIRERLLGLNHLDVAETRAELGRYLGTEAGELLVRDALRVQREQLGHTDPAVAGTLTSLCRLLTVGRGRHVEAEACGREALEIYRQRVGSDSVDAIETERWVAWALLEQKRYGEAELIVRSTLDRCERMLPESHPARSVSLLSLGMALVGQSRVAEGEARMRESLSLAQTHANLDPAGQALMVLSNTLRVAQRHREAQQVAREHIALTRRNSQREPLMLARDLAVLARNLLEGGGDPAEAEAAARESLALREVHDGKRFLTQSARALVAGAMMGQKRYAEAEAAYLEAYRQLTDVAKAYPKTADEYFLSVIPPLVRLYVVWGRSADAKLWLEWGLAEAARMKNYDVGRAETFEKRLVESGSSMP